MASTTHSALETPSTVAIVHNPWHGWEHIEATEAD